MPPYAPRLDAGKAPPERKGNDFTRILELASTLTEGEIRDVYEAMIRMHRLVKVLKSA